ncbi:hypothetical protein [Rhodoplanes serenus]|uniref:hypothetical protein n=1 Tax=Rhodoplanes serenus TaxID=200615 RepID=UPI001AEE1325|nr:hypothetical protein [Rhodoplanes serenus]
MVRIRDKAATGGKRRYGNYVRSVLSTVFGWGVERGYLAINPAKGVKNLRRPKGLPDANRPWMDAERHAVLDHAPAHMRPALALMAFTGLGPGDTLRLPKGFYKDGRIATRRSKTGEPVYWPAPAPLRAALADAPDHDADTLCANSEGKAWTVDGFRTSWGKLRQKLEEDELIGPGLTPVRAPAQRGGDSAGVRLRRTHDRRRPRPEDDRDGAPLCARGGPVPEDGRCGGDLRRGADPSPGQSVKPARESVKPAAPAEGAGSEYSGFAGG